MKEGDEGIHLKAMLGMVSLELPIACETISLTAHSKEMMEQLQIQNGVKDPQDLIEEAFSALLNQRQKRVPLTEFDLSEKNVAKEANKLDLNRDGFLTYREMELGFKALHDQKVRTRQLVYLLGILFTFTIILLGGNFAVVWLVVDHYKDIETLNGALVNRVDRTPLQVLHDRSFHRGRMIYEFLMLSLQVASTDFYIQDGVLKQRPAAIPTSNLDLNTTPVPQSWGDSTIQTAQTSYNYDSINSAMSNYMIQEMKYISISASTDPNAPFIRAEVQGASRIPNMGGPGDGSVVLMSTVLGRFVLNGSDLSPESAEIANMKLLELYHKAIAQPVSSRRQITGSTTCNRQNACPSKLRRTETQCCIGQIFDCAFSTYQGYPCPNNHYCSDSGDVSNHCSDLQFSYTSGSEGSNVQSGLYSIDSMSWNGYPVHVNSVSNYALIFYDQTVGWVMYPFDPSNPDYKSGSLQLSRAVATSHGSLNPKKGWSSFSVVETGKTVKQQVHCPGSSAKVPSLDNPGTYVYYAPPYFRICAFGFMCPTPSIQLICDNIWLTVTIPMGSPGYRIGQAYQGKYLLSSSGTINNYQYYTNQYNSNLRLALDPVKGFGFTGSGSDSIYQTTANPISPLQPWDSGVTVSFSGDWTSYHVQCPSMPTIAW